MEKSYINTSAQKRRLLVRVQVLVDAANENQGGKPANGAEHQEEEPTRDGHVAKEERAWEQ
jgi:hypothetical protein